MKLIKGEVPASDAALIGDDDIDPAEVTGSGKFLRCPRIDTHMRGITAVINFLHECAVAVDEKGRFEDGGVHSEGCLPKLFSSSAREQVAVPSLPTTIPAAWFAISAASS